MDPEPYLFDSSAILTLIEDEPGADPEFQALEGRVVIENLPYKTN